MSRRLLAAGAAVVVAAAALVALCGWYFLLRDHAEPTSIAGAIAAFRTQQTGEGKSPVPAGVYVYDMIGDVRYEEDARPTALARRGRDRARPTAPPQRRER